MRRYLIIALAAAALLALFVGVRRWIHHAQLELVPVLVAPGADAHAIVDPPPSEIVTRMVLDVRELVAPPQRQRLAVLTFDDGPYPIDTPALASVLRDLDVPADFFLIGNDARRQPAIAGRLSASGIEACNHSLTHPEMRTLSFDAQRREIVDGAAAVRDASGAVASFFRPPHGNFDENTVRAALDSGETLALWDIDPGDWRSLTADDITKITLEQARAPAVILLHDGKDATIDALPRIVAAYRKAGFRFVTLSQLVRSVPLGEINDPMKVSL